MVVTTKRRKNTCKINKETGELEKCGQELKINSLTRYTDFQVKTGLVQV